MPILIFNNDTGDDVDFLCRDEWNLPIQVDELQKWVRNSVNIIEHGNYIADIGFCWRRNSSGGGPVIDYEFMKDLLNIGVSLHLSEYPGFSDEDESARNLKLYENMKYSQNKCLPNKAIHRSRLRRPGDL